MEGRALEAVDVAGLGGLGQQAHGVDEAIQLGLGLGLGRLDQHGPVDDQGEVHGHRVEALVDHRLGEVERGDVRALQPFVVEQGLVHARTLGEGGAHQVRQAGLDVVGVQDGVLGHLTQTVRAVAHHVGQGAHIHAHLPLEGAQTPEGLSRLVFLTLDQLVAVARVHDPRGGRERS
ncbi:hypothetical protein D3C85_785620 [compost metagenome]